MMAPLEDIIKAHIREHGFMSVEDFMSLALGHKTHGYYMKKDPFGQGGDFTTAPEISQMFGEMIGAWVADTWSKMGAPPALNLLECGAGRGTLMADILRATKNVDGLHNAVSVHILEMSPVLKAKQADALQGCLEEGVIRWHETLADFEARAKDAPSIILGNEFLDALPITQYINIDGLWCERALKMDEQGNITLSYLEKCMDERVEAINLESSSENILEISPARENFMRDVSYLLKRNTGAGLFIDYGHIKTATGDTLQAVYEHKYCDILEHIGDADITSHVDFDALIRVSRKAGGDVFELQNQGAFLKTLGIEHRAQSLYKNARESQKRDILTAFDRLTSVKHMGQIFKVMGVGYGLGFTPAGF